ncbi:hypothetical protein SDC9_70319 [bioreactor metagenome]|uniref:Ig-like domain-containing protein n=1 Tax=bioreactor metagenome TaxID=1076179 RepID=A0A644Y5L2_9ZZZZ
MFKEIFLAIVVLTVVSTMAEVTSTGVEIQTPQAADVLKGSVEIKGSVSESGFISASLYYAYADTTVETWFLIQTISQPVTDGVLASWDTSSISDGNYKLKLSVLRKSGEIQEVVVDHLQVRNYTPAQVVAPTQAVEVEVLQTATEIPEKPVITVTAYPNNRAAVAVTSVADEIKNGLIVGIFCILAFGIYTSIRGWFYRR